jgi:hypothetical protein
MLANRVSMLLLCLQLSYNRQVYHNGKTNAFLMQFEQAFKFKALRASVFDDAANDLEFSSQALCLLN